MGGPGFLRKRMRARCPFPPQVKACDPFRSARRGAARGHGDLDPDRKLRSRYARGGLLRHRRPRPAPAQAAVSGGRPQQEENCAAGMAPPRKRTRPSWTPCPVCTRPCSGRTRVRRRRGRLRFNQERAPTAQVPEGQTSPTASPPSTAASTDRTPTTSASRPPTGSQPPSSSASPASSPSPTPPSTPRPAHPLQHPGRQLAPQRRQAGAEPRLRHIGDHLRQRPLHHGRRRHVLQQNHPGRHREDVHARRQPTAAS